MISRRRALSSLGLATAFGLFGLPAMMASDAEAQTAGMERRQDRREGRQDRREDRRDARQDRRDERRGTTTTGSAGSTTGAAPK
jgi:hypothetical protein